MKSIFPFIVFLIFDLTSSCPSGSVVYSPSNSCFKFVTKPSYFVEADESCLALGGHLASVESAFVDGFIQGQAEIFFANTSTSFWLGGSTLYIPGNWSWTDGSSFGYTNWANGQPNPNNNTICLSNRYKVGKWYGESCFIAKPYVCKFPNPNSTQATTARPTNSPQSTTARTTGKCRNGWSTFNQTKRCYLLIHNVNYTQAVTTCQNFSSSFVSIHSAQENNFTHTLCLQKQNAYFCRIGLHNTNGNFIWVDGSKLDYTNWYPGQPNPSYQSATLTADNEATWYVLMDDQVHDAICAYYL